MALKGLKRLYRDFVRDTNALIRRFNTPIPTVSPFDESCPPAHQDGRSLLTILLQNFWSDYCRQVILLSAAGTKTIDGHKLAFVGDGTTFLQAKETVRDVADLTADTMGWDNPVWHNHQFVISVAEQLNVENYDEIFNALSPDLIVGYLNKVRNFVVHPHTETQARFQKVAAAYGIPGATVGELLSSLAVGKATLFETWIKSLHKTAQDAAR